MNQSGVTNIINDMQWVSITVIDDDDDIKHDNNSFCGSFKFESHPL